MTVRRAEVPRPAPLPLAQVTSGRAPQAAKETPIAASRFGLSVDGVQVHTGKGHADVSSFEPAAPSTRPAGE